MNTTTRRASQAGSVVPLRHKKINAAEAFHIVSEMECDVSACRDFGIAIALMADGLEGQERERRHSACRLCDRGPSG